MKKQLNSFKISQYILLFFMIVICIWLALWLTVSDRKQNMINPQTNNIMQVNNDSVIKNNAGN